ncbi:FxLYD domain-containing protein [Leptospira sp. FAT2]|uniref:FxLYD domain-containing protein n=1 Tax=Leptospira sanjuanensis TaxID=2879643 RepID=UPI001EE91DEE|nr:FxLYD domain-containing protein [Leptospira sanjuanensis]MCG6194595.1 FxLYD domain-containing protein [Leptospira sanjuanensis]
MNHPPDHTDLSGKRTSLLNPQRIVFDVFSRLVLLVLVPVLLWSKPQGEFTLDGKFKYYNVGLQDQFTYLEINGQIENLSGKDYSEAFFTMNIYDKEDNLLESCQFAIQGLPAGHKRDFYASAKFVDMKLIKRFTIEFEGSN